MVHLGERAFDTIGGAVVSTTAFVFRNSRLSSYSGTFIRAVAGRSEAEKRQILLAAIRDRSLKTVFHTSQNELVGIPGSPIAYWVSSSVRAAFGNFSALREISVPRQGNTTTDNDRFVRFWSEISFERLGLNYASASKFVSDEKKWVPYNKGGGSRRWFGQNESVVNWEQNGKEIKDIPHSVIANETKYFAPGLTWSTVSTRDIGFRCFGNGFVFDNKGACIFVSEEMQKYLAALLNTKAFVSILYQINPSVSLQPGDVAKFPVIPIKDVNSLSIISASERCVVIAKSDWDASETSWDFTKLPLLALDFSAETLARSYDKLRAHWIAQTAEMQRLEGENNRIFIDAYSLEDELSPEVPLEEITLTCNPAYRYSGKTSQAELDARLLSDTMAEFLHYAVGCMFGRYSLDTPGLILANQGEGLVDYLARVPEPTFAPDADNVIPVVDGDWFANDIAARFRKFLRVTFGEPNFQENLSFIEAALGKDIGKWFTRDFFEYHVRRYKKRPIYWMFSSPKGTFNALIYMHRYRPDTVSVVLNDYLREFISRLQAERARLDKLADDPAASQAQRTKALKDISVLIKQIDELTHWERDVVFPLAQAKIEIDLDDGVKANYPKFGAALKAIKGLDGKEDE